MISRQSSKQISLVAAAVLLAGVTALAQQPGTTPGAQTPGQQQPMPGQAGYPGGMSMSSSIGNPESQVDQAFMRETLQNNQAQVRMSQLAQQKSPSDDVKQFSQQMVQIHTQLTDQLRPLAKQMGVNEPKDPSKSQKQEIAKLEALSGPDFDAAYLQVMAREQQHTLKQFNEEARISQDPDVQKAAKLDAPVLSQHLQVLHKLAETHNVTLESKQ